MNIKLPEIADKIEYAQLLNDASEIKIQVHDPNQEHTSMSEKNNANTLILELPIQRPDVAVPVIELFLK